MVEYIERALDTVEAWRYNGTTCIIFTSGCDYECCLEDTFRNHKMGHRPTQEDTADWQLPSCTCLHFYVVYFPWNNIKIHCSYSEQLVYWLGIYLDNKIRGVRIRWTWVHCGQCGSSCQKWTKIWSRMKNYSCASPSRLQDQLALLLNSLKAFSVVWTFYCRSRRNLLMVRWRCSS